MNLYYIDSGNIRYFSKKKDAEKAAQKEADLTKQNVIVSLMFIATDRDNIALLANKEMGFNKFIGRLSVAKPREHLRPKLKLKKIAAALTLLFMLLLPNLTEAASCTTRRSGSVVITTCTNKNTHSQCRSYRSGSVIKTHCR